MISSLFSCILSFQFVTVMKSLINDEQKTNDNERWQKRFLNELLTDNIIK